MTLDRAHPLVYLITPGLCEAGNYAASSGDVLDVIAVAVDLGVDLIQIREKHLTGKLLFDLTHRSAEITRGSCAKILVNDRLDIAIAAGADGVHLAASSMPVAAARACAPPGFLIGASTHSHREISEAGNGGVDFVLFGPVFQTPGKDSVGIEALASAAANGIPVLAIGGIDETNFQHALDAGAAGIAAIRALNNVSSFRRIMGKVGR